MNSTYARKSEEELNKLVANRSKNPMAYAQAKREFERRAALPKKKVDDSEERMDDIRLKRKDTSHTEHEPRQKYKPTKLVKYRSVNPSEKDSYDRMTEATFKVVSILTGCTDTELVKSFLEKHSVNLSDYNSFTLIESFKSFISH